MKYHKQGDIRFKRFFVFVLASVFLAFQFALALPFVWPIVGWERVPFVQLGSWVRLQQFYATVVWLPIALAAVLPGFFVQKALHVLCRRFGLKPGPSNLIVSGTLGILGWVLFVLAIYLANPEGNIWLQFLYDSVYLLAMVPAAVLAGFFVIVRGNADEETDARPDNAIVSETEGPEEKLVELRGYWRPGVFRFAFFLVVSGIAAILGAIVLAFAQIFVGGASISFDNGVALAAGVALLFPIAWLSYVLVGLFPSFVAYLGVRGFLHQIDRASSASVVAASGCAILVCWLTGALVHGEFSENNLLHTPGWESSIWFLLPSSMLIGLLILRRQETRRVSEVMKYQQNECA
ncbi:hypothetical protein [Ruegeria atlantica]|uniref:hypothetical protein n=1 Tax=Ruegeria atlantica TaxID=81569 RepID=UPI00147B2A23|nr:hypothetical protein [Ruegeria atlantica]